MNRAILVFTALLPFLPAVNIAQGIDLSSVRLAVLGLSAIVVVSGVLRRRLLLPATPAVLCAIGFAALAAVSLLWAQDVSFAVRKAAFFLSLLPVTLLALEVRTPRLLQALIGGAAVSAAVGLTVFLTQFFSGADAVVGGIAQNVAPRLWGLATADAVTRFPSWYVEIGGRAVLRTFLPFPDPHTAALFWGMGFFLVMANNKRQRVNNRSGRVGIASKARRVSPLSVLSSLSPLVLLAAILMSFARGAYVAFLGAAFAYVVQQILFRKPRHAIRAVVFSVAAAALLAGTVGRPVAARFGSAFNLEEGSIAARLSLWGDAKRIFFAHPSIGAGIGSFAALEDPGASYRDPTNAHSTYLEIAAELGIAGAALFIAALGMGISSAFREGKKGSTAHAGIAAALVFFAVHSVFETNLYSPANFTVFLILLTLTEKSEDANKIQHSRGFRD